VGTLGIADAVVDLTPTGAAGPLAYVLTGWTDLGGGLFRQAGTYGSVVVDTLSNTLTYTLDNALQATNGLAAGQAASDAFTIAISDGVTTVSDPVVFAVAGTNDAPVAGPDIATTGYAKPVVVNVASLLANDSDPEQDLLSVVGVSGALHGVVSLSAQGQVTFTPYLGYVGAAGFSYSVSDGHGGISTASVSVSVTSVSGSAPAYVSAAGAPSGQMIDVSGDGKAHAVLASAFDDRILGGAGADRLNGSAGQDRINGGGGDDVITGGPGSDALYGGPGGDHFVWLRSDLLASPAAAQDGVYDFEGAGDGRASGDSLIFLGFSPGSSLALQSQSGVDPHLFYYTLTDGASGATELIGVHSLDGRALVAGDYLFL